MLKTLVGLLSIGLATAHMELSWPYPLRSKFDPQNNSSDIDYSMTAPLLADGVDAYPYRCKLIRNANPEFDSVGSNFPCKGYQKDTPFRATTEYTAGNTYNMTLAGSATHGGGSCQLSLSYDNGDTFHVIQSMEGGCPLTSTYDFKVPSDVPNGNALFAWTWFNLIGNREMYMNCVDVVVSGGSGSAQSFTSAYPKVFVANVNNGCSTVENKQTVFASPGKEVVYGQGVSSSLAPFPNCS
jgi:hypothetical protein